MNWKWLPNAVSISRFFPLSILVFVCAIYGHWTTAAIFSAIAIATDPFDGWLAVKLNARSKAGTIIDPICDFLLTVAQVAGAFFGGVIGWPTIGILALFFLLTWPPVVLTRAGSRANKIALGINRVYFVGVVIAFVGLYFYQAFGWSALWLIIPAVPLTVWGARVSMSHH